MKWAVELTAKVNRQKERLPRNIRTRLDALLHAIEASGPVQPSITHISEMERGKRTIGKAMARRLGEALDFPYKAFL